jgi:predicted nuclease of restriction endonuclease-like (RecB) superfamily
MAGLSALNLWRMRAFYLTYAVSDQKLSQLVTESNSASKRKLKQPVSEAPVKAARESHGQKLSQAATQSIRAPIELVASLPWGHNIVLMQKVKEIDARLWYARAALEHGWSRAVLMHQVETKLHRREGKAITNFAAALPAPLSDLAHQTLKDPYIFDFLTMDAGARERDLAGSSQSRPKIPGGTWRRLRVRRQAIPAGSLRRRIFSRPPFLSSAVALFHGGGSEDGSV